MNLRLLFVPFVIIAGLAGCATPTPPPAPAAAPTAGTSHCRSHLSPN